MIINGLLLGAGTLKWFTGLKTFAPKPQSWLVGCNEIEIPTLVFWGELDVLFDVK